MAIDSKAFGPVTLSEEDAVQFKAQVEQGPSEAAVRLVGRILSMNQAADVSPESSGRPSLRVVTGTNG